MKRYIVTEDQLKRMEDNSRELSGAYSPEDADPGQLYADALASLRSREVPEWATHFYTQFYDEASGQWIQTRQEIPQ